MLGVVDDEGFAGSNRGTLGMAFFCGNPPDLDYAERAIRVAANEAPSLTGVVTVEPATPSPLPDALSEGLWSERPPPGSQPA